jgi:hypothetical protein
MNKELLTYILLTLLAIGIGYLSLSFVELSINFIEWSVISRIVLLITSIGASFWFGKNLIK